MKLKFKYILFFLINIFPVIEIGKNLFEINLNIFKIIKNLVDKKKNILKE